jgi:hypothetical protein
MKLLIVLISLLDIILSKALFEPPDGKVYLGAWLDFGNGDTTLKFNKDMNFNASFFQEAQDMPLKPNPRDNLYAIDATKITDLNTDAFIFLTVYPRDMDAAMEDNVIANLTGQVKAYNDKGTRVFLRLGPEMNGYLLFLYSEIGWNLDNNLLNLKNYGLKFINL